MNFWETVKALLGYGNGKDPNVIDHVQANESAGYRKKINKKLAEALAKAERRHGKPFHTHENKPRETPPSRDLLAIQEQQQKIAVVINAMKESQVVIHEESKPAITVTKIKVVK